MKRCLAILLFSLALAPACSRMDGSSQWIRQAHDANLQADQAIRRGDPAAARAALAASLDRQVPGTVNPEDGRMVKQDMCFRLALVDMDAHRPEDALAWAKRGLELGRRQDLFTANLLVAEGRALEALGREPDAAEAYHRALKINEILLDRAMDSEKEQP
jgi:tetratricopeptide (TPR) repeat protein